MKRVVFYAVYRLLILVPFLCGITGIAFLLGVIAPGDPAMTLLTMDGSYDPTVAELEAMRHTLGLDRPLWEQYLQWLFAALRGDFGISYLSGRSVLDEMLWRFPVTLSLATCAMMWVVFLGISLGTWAAYRMNSSREWILRIVVLLLLSVPSFWLGILCMLLFSEEWQLLPSGGYGTIWHMILPSFVLASGAMAATIRLQQTAVWETMKKPFVLTERAKGLPMPYILMRHVLPNSLFPVMTMIGTFFGAALGGSVIVEDLFSIPGLGSYVLAAIWGRDYPVIQGYVVLSGTVFIVFNYLVDISYYALNPLLKHGEEP